MLTIDWAMRATCIDTRMRPSDGTASRALYEAVGVSFSVTACGSGTLRGCHRFGGGVRGG
jgi:hypothetical protein